MRKESNQIKVAGYTRVSTALQVKEGESLESQEDAIKLYVKSHGYKLFKIYKDEGVSGASENRSGLNKLRKEAAEGKFKKVIFKKLTRFGRNAKDVLHLFDEFEKKLNIDLISLEENFDTGNASGKLTRTMLAAIAEFERDTIKAQMQEGKLRKLKKNEIFIGQIPFGYKFNKEQIKMEYDEAQKKLYLEMVDLYLYQGLSFKDIAISLNRSGKKSPDNKKWTSATISYLFKNPAYKGKFIANKYEYVTANGKSNRVYEKNENGKRVAKTKAKKDWIPFTFPKIIEEDIWDNIQRKTEQNKKIPKNVADDDLFLLRGLIFCRECGAKVSTASGSKRKDGTRPTYYRCHWASTSKKNREETKRKKCSSPSAKMGKVDGSIWSELLAHILHPERYLKKFISEKKDSKSKLENKLNDIASEIKNNERKLDKFLNKFEEGSADVMKAVNKKINDLGSEIKALKGEKKIIESQLVAIKHNEKSLKKLDFSKYRNKMLKCLHSLPGKEKKHIIRLLIAPEDGGKIEIGYARLADVLDFEEIEAQNLNPWDKMVYDEPIIETNYHLQMEKVVGIFDYLKNNGYFNDNIKLKGLETF
ncbi:MAG TPA: recombinase family protein [Nitrospinota bacterium]|nr:recombinase family protein [Nitrospinota bacterium]|tara:strand:+ start:308 stop:2074 length:1767 start_codon:yes stop_codon:yes gene_type:complete